jgi:hypothetical protein
MYERTPFDEYLTRGAKMPSVLATTVESCGNAASILILTLHDSDQFRRESPTNKNWFYPAKDGYLGVVT